MSSSREKLSPVKDYPPVKFMLAAATRLLVSRMFSVP